jgi:hypothetical protein
VARLEPGELPQQVMVMPPDRLDGQEAQVTIRAFDAAGNSGERSTPVRVDGREPKVIITPALGSTVVNGKLVATDTKAGYAFTLNPKRYGKKFSVQLRSYDKAGNVTATAKRTYRR